THGYAVRDGDGVVLNRRTTGGANASLHMLGQVAGIERAGHHLDPGMRHPDQWPRQVFVGETNGLKHSTSWRAIRTIGDVTTVVFQGIGHECSSPVGKNPSALRLRLAPYGTICIGIQQHERKHMVLSRLRPTQVRWLWSVVICVSLSGCSGAYHFRYQYAMV